MLLACDGWCANAYGLHFLKLLELLHAVQYISLLIKLLAQAMPGHRVQEIYYYESYNSLFGSHLTQSFDGLGCFEGVSPSYSCLCKGLSFFCFH